jgi:hypothetical protein
MADLTNGTPIILVVIGGCVWLAFGLVLLDTFHAHRPTYQRLVKLPWWFYLVLTIFSLVLWPAPWWVDRQINKILDRWEHRQSKKG